MALLMNGNFQKNKAKNAQKRQKMETLNRTLNISPIDFAFFAG